MSDTTVETVNLKRAMINSANQVILLIDGVSDEDAAAFAAQNTRITRVSVADPDAA